MDLKFIESIISAVDKSSLDFFEVEINENFPMKLKLGRNGGQSYVLGINHENDSQYRTPQIPVKTEEETSKARELKMDTKKKEIKEAGIHEIKAPIVGIFYSTPGPDKDPFVKVGDKVKKGQTLCIIEAMKVMNEIESDIDGEIVEIKSIDREMVEFDQVIFTIK